MTTLTQPILVGVTGAGENTAALQFALSEARATGRGVTLVHAVSPVMPPPPPSILITDDTWAEVGSSIVSEARREMETLLAGEPITVTTLVHHGAPGSTFADLSGHATKIVLQHRDLSRLHHLVTGSTVAQVAAHTHCPVVSVPATGAERSPTGVVTAGIHADGKPTAVLEAAFAEASARGASVRLLHAWQVPPAYGYVLPDEAGWGANNKAAIESSVSDLRAKYPDTEVSIDILREWPADCLARASAASDLLVLGRHNALPGLPSRLGSLARTVLMHAACPVEIVPL
jgi:nucleotide-binding universal stress UspA family protein